MTARLWCRCPERFWQALQEKGFQSPYTTVGLLVLGRRAQESDIPVLLTLLKIRIQGGSCPEPEASALYQALEVLEEKAPEPMRALAPEILLALGRGVGDEDAVLTARVLVLLARLGLHEVITITPLIERLQKEPNHRVTRRWVRRVAREVRKQEPAPSSACALVRLLRVLALEKTLESGLMRQLARRTKPEVRRAWRWLQRSNCVIETVTDAQWRAHFYQSRERIMEKVRRSRKQVHVQARSTVGQ